MIFRDSKGNIVALIRHSTREGNAVESAAEELAQDLSDFIQSN
ncbi:MAG TPA: hypothetical protein VMT00_10620 [Thermoanaerobaculia bacterium]|nr:hypothetical protein [Thermoanaerobaculia bacterium]